jgi:hypothetical protein
MINKLGGQVLGHFTSELSEDPEMVKIAMKEVATRHETKGYDGTEENRAFHNKSLEHQMRFFNYSKNPDSIYAPHNGMLKEAYETHAKQMQQQGIAASFSPTSHQQVSQPSALGNTAPHL